MSRQNDLEEKDGFEYRHDQFLSQITVNEYPCCLFQNFLSPYHKPVRIEIRIEFKTASESSEAINVSRAKLHFCRWSTFPILYTRNYVQFTVGFETLIVRRKIPFQATSLLLNCGNVAALTISQDALPCFPILFFAGNSSVFGHFLEVWNTAYVGAAYIDAFHNKALNLVLSSNFLLLVSNHSVF